MLELALVQCVFVRGGSLVRASLQIEHVELESLLRHKVQQAVSVADTFYVREMQFLRAAPEPFIATPNKRVVLEEDEVLRGASIRVQRQTTRGRARNRGRRGVSREGSGTAIYFGQCGCCPIWHRRERVPSVTKKMGCTEFLSSPSATCQSPAVPNPCRHLRPPPSSRQSEAPTSLPLASLRTSMPSVTAMNKDKMLEIPQIDGEIDHTINDK